MSAAVVAADPVRRERQTRILRPVIAWLRAGAIAFGWLLIAVGARPVGAAWLLAATVLLVAVATWRVFWPDQGEADPRAALVVEPLVATVAVLATGGFSSPFVLYLIVPVVTTAVVVGPRVLGLVAAMGALLAAHEIVDGSPASGAEVAQGLVPMAAAAGIGLVSWRLFTQAEDEQSRTLGRMQQLAHVNALLSTLHDIVRSTAAPLTIEDVLRVIRGELDELFRSDTVVLLLADEGGRWWRPVSTDGVAASWPIARADLPDWLLAHRSARPLEHPSFDAGAGVTPDARSGAYLWLYSRGQPGALLVLEHGEPRELPAARLEVLERMSAPLGLAVDNAVWFQRLRRLGAEEERQRIGATLHDRFAQSLAYVNMELGRLVDAHPEDAGLARLRGDVRDTLADLRETLRELRMRCTEERGLAPTLAEHLDRFGDRFGVIVDLDVAADVVRAPLSVENQLLRIVQDLLVLAQREGAATSIHVAIATDSARLRVVVHDDGRGLPEADLGHAAATLLSLVRERSDAIGGIVDVDAASGTGTRVAVTVHGLL